MLGEAWSNIISISFSSRQCVCEAEEEEASRVDERDHDVPATGREQNNEQIFFAT